MVRETRSPRPDWREKVEKWGLTYHTFEGKPYWCESAAYRFERSEVEILESATNELHRLCLLVAERLIETDQLSRVGIPEHAHAAIRRAWDQDPPAIYGRFDLAYSGEGNPKLLEYNADTPTSLLEAAVVQWHWREEVEPESDQFNSIWECLIEKWTELRKEGLLPSGRVHFACVNVPEDLMTTAVLMDTASEAGLFPELLPMSTIGWDPQGQQFVDRSHLPIETLFKLYPWEWMLREEFGEHALSTYGRLQWIEPIWKMVLSNKAILAVLWEMFPDHPNLLPAYLDSPRELSEFVVKPRLGREGANVSIHRTAGTIRAEGPYDDEGWVYQGYAPLFCDGQNHAVIGSWVVDGAACGIGIRESDGPITEDTSRFVPHYFRS